MYGLVCPKRMVSMKKEISLPPEDAGQFARLPWLARAAAIYLRALCDEDGRIHVPVHENDKGDTLGERFTSAVSFCMGATKGDRRVMRSSFQLLFDVGYLAYEQPYVMIRDMSPNRTSSR